MEIIGSYFAEISKSVQRKRPFFLYLFISIFVNPTKNLKFTKCFNDNLILWDSIKIDTSWGNTWRRTIITTIIITIITTIIIKIIKYSFKLSILRMKSDNYKYIYIGKNKTLQKFTNKSFMIEGNAHLFFNFFFFFFSFLYSTFIYPTENLK